MFFGKLYRQAARCSKPGGGLSSALLIVSGFVRLGTKKRQEVGAGFASVSRYSWQSLGKQVCSISSLRNGNPATEAMLMANTFNTVLF